MAKLGSLVASIRLQLGTDASFRSRATARQTTAVQCCRRSPLPSYPRVEIEASGEASECTQQGHGEGDAVAMLEPLFSHQRAGIPRQFCARKVQEALNSPPSRRSMVRRSGQGGELGRAGFHSVKCRREGPCLDPCVLFREASRRSAARMEDADLRLCCEIGFEC
eukprot:scaffold4971_cov254-Pinguiococcus_pyrenoidosus.AAC.13